MWANQHWTWGGKRTISSLGTHLAIGYADLSKLIVVSSRSTRVGGRDRSAKTTPMSKRANETSVVGSSGRTIVSGRARETRVVLGSPMSGISVGPRRAWHSNGGANRAVIPTWAFKAFWRWSHGARFAKIPGIAIGATRGTREAILSSRANSRSNSRVAALVAGRTDGAISCLAKRVIASLARRRRKSRVGAIRSGRAFMAHRFKTNRIGPRRAEEHFIGIDIGACISRRARGAFRLHSHGEIAKVALILGRCGARGASIPSRARSAGRLATS